MLNRLKCLFTGHLYFTKTAQINVTVDVVKAGRVEWADWRNNTHSLSGSPDSNHGPNHSSYRHPAGNNPPHSDTYHHSARLSFSHSTANGPTNRYSNSHPGRLSYSHTHPSMPLHSFADTNLPMHSPPHSLSQSHCNHMSVLNYSHTHIHTTFLSHPFR